MKLRSRLIKLSLTSHHNDTASKIVDVLCFLMLMKLPLRLASLSAHSAIAQLPREPRQLDTGMKLPPSVHSFKAQFHRQAVTFNC